jgi:ubiquitin-conjugating enzyme E2 J2
MHLSAHPVEGILARPLDDDILTWHYLIRGPPETPYAGGVYHGRIIFPPQYPFAPPSIYMDTPSGRFQTNTRICLSMSDFHPETWNPMWRIETLLVGLVSFMTTDDASVGTIKTSNGEKIVYASRSIEANKNNEVVMELFPNFMKDLRLESESSSSSSSLLDSSSSMNKTKVSVSDILSTPPPLIQNIDKINNTTISRELPSTLSSCNSSSTSESPIDLNPIRSTPISAQSESTITLSTSINNSSDLPQTSAPLYQISPPSTTQSSSSSSSSCSSDTTPCYEDAHDMEIISQQIAALHSIPLRSHDFDSSPSASPFGAFSSTSSNESNSLSSSSSPPPSSSLSTSTVPSAINDNTQSAFQSQLAQLHASMNAINEVVAASLAMEEAGVNAEEDDEVEEVEEEPYYEVESDDEADNEALRQQRREARIAHNANVVAERAAEFAQALAPNLPAGIQAQVNAQDNAMVLHVNIELNLFRYLPAERRHDAAVLILSLLTFFFIRWYILADPE